MAEDRQPSRDLDSDAEDEDIHLCIKCRQSILGIDNYVTHRKQTCPRLPLNRLVKKTETNFKPDSQTSKSTEHTLNLPAKESWSEALGNQLGERDDEPNSTDGFIPSVKCDETTKSGLEKNNGCPTSGDNHDQDLERDLASKSNTLSEERGSTKCEKDVSISTDHFSRFCEPLFHNDAAVSSFFKSIDSFGEGKFSTLADHHILYKDMPENFSPAANEMDQRYPDLYAAYSGHSSQETVQHGRNRSSRSVLRASKDSTDENPHKSAHVQHDSAMPSLQVEQLKQDDFLSSLDLSSVKLIHDKRKYSYDDEEDEDDEDEHRPPSYHTGGKWRPGMMPPPSTVAGKWRPFSPTNQEQPEDDNCDITTLNRNLEAVIDKPRIATKGKWLPGNRSRDTDEPDLIYKCEECSMDFIRKSAYTRHMNNHKNSLQAASNNSGLTSSRARPSRETKLKAQFFMAATIKNFKRKKILAPPPSLPYKSPNDDTSTMEKKKSNVLDIENAINKKSSSIEIKPSKMMCPICRLSFGTAYLSKHFASLAHIHNELEYKRTLKKETENEQDKIVLDNIDILVNNCHFECSGCKFFCNLESDLTRHVSTHTAWMESSTDALAVKYSCSACEEEELMSNTELMHHIMTQSHIMSVRDRILNAQKTVIRTHWKFICSQCKKSFRFCRQFIDHFRKQHEQKEFVVSSHTSRLCPVCPYRGHSCKQVKQHIIMLHKHIRINQKNNSHYICYLCGTLHETAKESRLHRCTSKHRQKSLQLKKPTTTIHCKFCYSELESLSALRTHLTQEHMSHLTPCVRCASIPVLQSNLREHQKVCNGVMLDSGFQHSCELCIFSSPLIAHVLLHATIVHGGAASDGLYTCHLCKVSSTITKGIVM